MCGLRAITSFHDIDTCILLNALEPSLVFGDKYPLLKTPKVTEWDEDNETKGDFFLRIENLNQNPQKREKQITDDLERRKTHVDNKPYGYWDNIFSNQGIYYKMSNSVILDKIKNTPFNSNLICKMTYDGLVKSDPKFIYKVILIIRYPHDKKEKDFLEKTISVCKWMLLNPEVDVHIIDYNDFIHSIDSVKLRISSILGLKQIDGELSYKEYNNVPENVLNKICRMIIAKDIEGAYEVALKEYKDRERASIVWKCLRTDKKTSEEQCKVCMSNKDFRDTLKKRAILNHIDWMHKPCIFECGKSLDLEPITFETSIKNNFWK